mmetsp:Transcript_31252/g.76246  ORF Transcript_31252/g.76246 Transcript_31252/m.76246 type:complete len:121 (-) Transcript_31252:371-733(-)
MSIYTASRRALTSTRKNCKAIQIGVRYASIVRSSQIPPTPLSQLSRRSEYSKGPQATLARGYLAAPAFEQQHGRTSIWAEFPSIEDVIQMAKSVLKKRRTKMNKHKHRKRMRKMKTRLKK